MNKEELSFFEFIALMGTMMALTAFSIDAFLPALTEIGEDLHVHRKEDVQLIISFIFIGSAIGQLFYGPMADSIGRKKPIYIGLFLFFIGSLMSIYADSLIMMLAGRIVQGMGLAGPKIVCVAMIRDRFSGDQMARSMSFILALLIIAPIVAPSIGLLVLKVSDWRMIFNVVLIYSIIVLIWFVIRQPETLKEEYKIAFSFVAIKGTLLIVLKNRVAMGYTIAAGFISGSFLGFLNSVQEIFQIQHGLGDKFPIYFGFIALSIGLASLTNGGLVMRYGMQKIATISVVGLTLSSIVLLFMVYLFYIPLTLNLLMGYLLLGLFFVGFLFGNLSSLSMEPLGEVAGMGSGVVGFLTTIITIPIGIIIGKMYNGSAIPMVMGFAIFGFLAYIIILLTNKYRRSIID